MKLPKLGAGSQNGSVASSTESSAGPSAGAGLSDNLSVARKSGPKSPLTSPLTSPFNLDRAPNFGAHAWLNNLTPRFFSGSRSVAAVVLGALLVTQPLGAVNAAVMSSDSGTVDRTEIMVGAELEPDGVATSSIESALADVEVTPAQAKLSRWRDFAQSELTGAIAPSDTNAHVLYRDGLFSALQQEGLPTRADGVRIYVLDNIASGHGGDIVRSIVGPVGLAPGADVLLIPRTYEFREMQSRFQSIDDFLTRATQKMRNIALNASANVASIREAHIEDGGGTALVNLSWGASIVDIAFQQVDRALEAPAGSPLHESLSEALGHAPSPKDRFRVAGILAERLSQRLEGSNPELDSALGVWTAEVEAAKDAGLLLFVAAGNEHDEARRWGHPSTDQNLLASVPGVIVVGAADIGEPADASDDRVAKFSSGGAVSFVLPGVDLPIEPDGGPTSGSSYSNGLGVSAGALALVASEHGLGPEALEVMLTDPGFSADLAGTERDGQGVLDVLALVRAAGRVD